MARILVMDSDTSIRMLYAGELEEEGYEVVTSGKISELKDLIHHLDPDLIVLDMNMITETLPVKGLKTLKDKAFPVVVLCSTFSSPKVPDGAFPVDYTIVKSSRTVVLKEKIREALDRRRKSGRTAARPALHPRKNRCIEQIPFPWALSL